MLALSTQTVFQAAPSPVLPVFSFSLSAKTLPKNSLPLVVCLQLALLFPLYPDHPGGGTAPALW